MRCCIIRTNNRTQNSKIFCLKKFYGGEIILLATFRIPFVFFVKISISLEKSNFCASIIFKSIVCYRFPFLLAGIKMNIDEIKNKLLHHDVHHSQPVFLNLVWYQNLIQDLMNHLDRNT